MRRLLLWLFPAHEHAWRPLLGDDSNFRVCDCGEIGWLV